MFNIKILIWLLLVFLVLWFVRKIINKFKVPKIGSMALFSGGVKCGKTTLAVATALSEYRARCRKVKRVNFFRKIFRKPLLEMPLLYSNIPLSVPYVPITEDLLLRKKRFVYNCVAYIGEASLVADSQMLADMKLNERLLLFNKLIGHETKGGCLIYDTQCVSDCHYSIKRCLSEYIYVHHLVKWIPFFLIAYVQECRYSDDSSTITAQSEDVENTLRKVIFRKRVWKTFDCYCYSSLTDNLPVEENVISATSLKATNIVSFRKSRLYGGVETTKPKKMIKYSGGYYAKKKY